YGDVVTIRTWMQPSPAAKILLHYEMRNKATDQIVATAETVQVFLDKERKLMIDLPEFYRAWKELKSS
ncbi:MAG TPA: acyl-CoA thioesterase, partial [Flavobacteriales bacterium]|nr:acyl-CoA thioesterase [Flavobacteriales bacterium]